MTAVAIAREATELLSDLIAIPSVNGMGRSAAPVSLAMVEYLERWFRKHDISCKRQAVPGGDCNLIATVPASGGGRTIFFDAHTDTVPADDWADRAFTPRVHEGCVYGRGACDTKGSLAAMMLALRDAAASTERPHSLVLLASADEEFARTGVRACLAGHPRVDYAVVGEPTCCHPVVACKGAARWEILVRGRSAHSSNPHKGVNAITGMSKVIGLLAEFERTVLSKRKHPLVSPPTLTPTLIQGGAAVNIVPDACRVTVDLRTAPDEPPERAMREVVAFLGERADCSIEHTREQFWAGADAAPGDPFIAGCIAACRAEAPAGQTIAPLGVDYGCHASEYAERGAPAIVIGPGDIAVAHSVDEHVPVEELVRAVRIHRRIMLMPLDAHLG